MGGWVGFGQGEVFVSDVLELVGGVELGGLERWVGGWVGGWTGR